MVGMVYAPRGVRDRRGHKKEGAKQNAYHQDSMERGSQQAEYKTQDPEDP